MSDVTESPIYAYRNDTYGFRPTQVGVVWSSERFELKTVGQWTNLGGATIPFHTGFQTTCPGALLVATFTAETLVQPEVAVGSLDITFGGQPGHPQSDNHRFATAKSAEEWGSVTTLRAMDYPYDAATMHDATVQVIMKLVAGTTFGVQNWLLKLEAYVH